MRTSEVFGAGITGFRLLSPDYQCYNVEMKTSLTVRKIGNSFGVILGKDALAELGIAEGDTLFVVRTADGIRLTPYDPDFAEAIEAGRDFMRRHRNALRELAR